MTQSNDTRSGTKPTQMKTICIIAGNHKQFKQHLTEKIQKARTYCFTPNEAIIDDVRYLYASSRSVLRGLNNVDFEFTGLWHGRRDIEEILEEASLRLIGQGKPIPWK